MHLLPILQSKLLSHANTSVDVTPKTILTIPASHNRFILKSPRFTLKQIPPFPRQTHGIALSKAIPAPIFLPPKIKLLYT